MNPEHPSPKTVSPTFCNTPDFFERHAELLAAVQLSSGHGSRAVSLQERQAGMLRERSRVWKRVVDMIRHGNDNEVIASRLQRWAQRMLGALSQPGARRHRAGAGWRTSIFRRQPSRSGTPTLHWRPPSRTG
jgi:uncharacterized protein YigA (DUF484 family)